MRHRPSSSNVTSCGQLQNLRVPPKHSADAMRLALLQYTNCSTLVRTGPFSSSPCGEGRCRTSGCANPLLVALWKAALRLGVPGPAIAGPGILAHTIKEGGVCQAAGHGCQLDAAGMSVGTI